MSHTVQNVARRPYSLNRLEMGAISVKIRIHQIQNESK